MVRTVFISGLLAMALLLSACGGPDDAQMTAAAANALKTDASTTEVTVTVKDGVALLSGKVADERSRARAEKLARVRGVRDVESRITIAKDQPGEGVDDATLKRKLEAALNENNCRGVRVSVKDGTAILSGEIDQLKVGECVMAARLISHKVENKLTFK